MPAGKKWKFTLSDGTTPLLMEWHRGTAAPNPAMGVISARMNVGRIEWATSKVRCPGCGKSYEIRPEGPGGYYGERRRLDKVVLGSGRIAEIEASNIAGELLDASAMEILALVGNVSMDVGKDLFSRCPACGYIHLVGLPSEAMDLEITESKGEVNVRCPRGETVVFEKDGRVRLSRIPRGDGALAEMRDLMSLPRMVGISQEGLGFLTLILGIGPGKQRLPGSINVTGIALRYRFRNYQDSFYKAAKEILAHREASQNARSSLFLLPVDGSDMDSLYKLLDIAMLPDKPSVRRACAKSPALLSLMAGTGVGKICGEDPNVAVSLFEAAEEDVALLLSLLNEDGLLSGFFRIIADEESPAQLVKRIKLVGPACISQVVKEYGSLTIGQYEAMKAYRSARKSYGMAALIDNPRLLLPYIANRHNADINYKVEDLDLEGEFGGYVFELPRTTQSLRAAGATLKNCLESYVSRIRSGKALIFLVRKGEKLVAAVEVNPESRMIVQFQGKANRGISPEEPMGRAKQKWADARGIKDRLIR